MSVELYQKGEQRTINGLTCNTMLVAPELFDVKSLPLGWFLTPEKAYEEVREQDEEIKADTKTEEKTEEVKVLRGNAKIRNDAKEAGIEDYKTARIATLKDKLTGTLVECHRCEKLISEKDENVIIQGVTGRVFCSEECIDEHLKSKGL